MNIYVFNLISIFIYSIIFMLLGKSFYKKNISAMLSIFIGVQLFFISAFRAKTVGIDLQRYIPRYSLIANIEWKDIFKLRHIVDFEYGYILYNKVVSTIFPNEQALLIITSAIVMFGFSYFIFKYSKIPWMSFYLFITLGFWGSSFNILRQYLAMSILVFSIKYVQERKFMKFCVCLGIAVLFHKTAIFYFLVYPLSDIKMDNLKLMVISLATTIVGFTSEYIIKFIVSYTSYSKYFEKIGSGLGNGSGEGNLVVLIVIIICILTFRTCVEKVDSNIQMWLNMIIVAVFFNVLALELGIFERVMRYFMIAVIIAIPNTIYSLRQLQLRLSGKALVILLTTYYYFKIVMSSYISSSGIIPYIFMWQ